MTTSLLSLPDELLALVVDEALDEYAPRLYKQRQDTCRALSLVNKRVGAIAQAKLLEAVHIAFGHHDLPATQPNKALKAGRARALYVTNGWNSRAIDSTWFAAVRDIRLGNMCAVRLDDIAQLRELRVLVLSECDLVASRPFVAVKLERLVLYFCDTDTLELATEPFTAAGCPSLQHLYLGLEMPVPPRLCAPDLVDAVVTLGIELFDTNTRVAPWSSLLPTDKRSRTPLFDKALFDLISIEIADLEELHVGVQHLRIHTTSESRGLRSAAAIRPAPLSLLANELGDLFPSLKTLYLPLALDPSRGMLSRPLCNAVHELVDACQHMRVVVFFEQDLNADGPGEDRASPHFEARCRRAEAERAAAQGARVEQGGARVA